MLLEHDPPVRAGSPDFGAIQKNLACRGRQEACDHGQKRCLPTARCAERDSELAGSDCQIQMGQSHGGGAAVTITNAEVLDFEYAALLLQEEVAPCGRDLPNSASYFAALTYSSVMNLE
jgi:hypothetical protein